MTEFEKKLTEALDPKKKEEPNYKKCQGCGAKDDTVRTKYGPPLCSRCQKHIEQRGGIR